MAKYVLTVTSKSGKNVGNSSRSSDSIAVYNDADLKKRLAAAKKNPDLTVTYRRTD